MAASQDHTLGGGAYYTKAGYQKHDTTFFPATEALRIIDSLSKSFFFDFSSCRDRGSGLQSFFWEGGKGDGQGAERHAEKEKTIKEEMSEKQKIQ